MIKWSNARFFVISLSLLALYAVSVRSMDSDRQFQERAAEIDKQKTCSEKFTQWSKEHGPSLVLSAAICAVTNHYWGDNEQELVHLFSQHAFADTITHSLIDIGKTKIIDRTTLIRSIGWLLAKNAGLYTTRFIWTNSALTFFSNTKFGFSDALLIAQVYTTASHFTNEEEHELKNNAELLEKILKDPRFAATCHELAKKTIEVVVHNPNIIAEQLNDPALQQKLAEIKANPELVKEYCRRSEAWLALQQELTMPNAVVASTSAPQPAPAVLPVPEDQAAADRETATHGVSLESTIGERHASDGSGSRRGSSPERIQHLDQLAEQLMQTFSQDPRFAELVETGLRRRISQRATAIAAAVVQKRANEEAAILEEVIAHEANEQQEVVRPEQPGLISRLGNWARGLRGAGESARDERATTSQSLGIVSVLVPDEEVVSSAQTLGSPSPLLSEKIRGRMPSSSSIQVEVKNDDAESWKKNRDVL